MQFSNLQVLEMEKTKCCCTLFLEKGLTFL